MDVSSAFTEPSRGSTTSAGLIHHTIKRPVDNSKVVHSLHNSSGSPSRRYDTVSR